jgi:hypothetical protein
MAKLWDDLMKMLVGANPQHFVSLLLSGAQFESELVTELKSRTIEADLLYIVIWNDQKVVLHVEFQRRRDGNMGKRLWEYNILTTYLSGLPVCSFALYLRKDGNIVKPPYQQILPDGEVVHLFYFRNIQLWELSAEMLKQPGVEGMLPLLPLMKGGSERQAIEEMIESLGAAGKQDLLPLGYAFAALVLDSEVERDWLRKRFDMLKDILEESWAYQEMVQKGLEKGFSQGIEQGLEKGLEKGIEKGKLEALRQAIVDVVEERFPEIIALTKKQVNAIEDPALLRRLNVKMSIAQTTHEAEQSLAALDTNGKRAE